MEPKHIVNIISKGKKVHFIHREIYEFSIFKHDNSLCAIPHFKKLNNKHLKQLQIHQQKTKKNSPSQRKICLNVARTNRQRESWKLRESENQQVQR